MQISAHPALAAPPGAAPSLTRHLLAGMRLVPLWTIIRLCWYLVIIGETLVGLALRLGARPVGAVDVQRLGLFQLQSAPAATGAVHDWPSIIIIDGSGSYDHPARRLVGSAHGRFAS